MNATSSTTLQVFAALSGHSGLILASDAARVGLQHELRREFDRQALIRLRRGVYVIAAEWDALGERALPPPHTCTRCSLAGTCRVLTRVRCRALGPADRGCQAVAVMDTAIHKPRTGRPLTTREELDRAFLHLGRVPGRGAAGRALEFASPLSGSPGESISRAGMFLLGFLLPELQTPHWDHDGLIGFTDFFWRDRGTVGEFDGHGKYLRDEFTGGRSAADIFLAEKVREDRLRALGLGVFRWDWPVATSLQALGDLLTRNGIPRAR